MPEIPKIPADPADRIRLKRAYRAVRVSDGTRVLVDRLWPRGVTKERLRLHLWMKEIAPSDALRRSFHAGDLSWEDFTHRYRQELAGQDEFLRQLAGFAQDGIVTLVYGSKDEAQNHAHVLRDYLRGFMTETSGAKAPNEDASNATTRDAENPNA